MISPGMRAIAVKGQADFTGNQANRGGGVTRDSLYLSEWFGNNAYYQAGVTAGDFLWVCDKYNNRILRYILPTPGDTRGANLAVGQQTGGEHGVPPVVDPVGHQLVDRVDGHCRRRVDGRAIAGHCPSSAMRARKPSTVQWSPSGGCGPEAVRWATSWSRSWIPAA